MTPDLSYDYEGGRENRRAKIINGMEEKKKKKCKHRRAKKLSLVLKSCQRVHTLNTGKSTYNNDELLLTLAILNIAHLTEDSSSHHARYIGSGSCVYV